MVKIIAVALICGCIILYLKNVNSELALLATIASGVILLSFLVEYVFNTITFFNQIIEKTGIDKNFYSIIFKITAIGYVVEFGSSTLNDFGLTGLSSKLQLIGKIAIFSVSIPIIYSIINMISGLL